MEKCGTVRIKFWSTYVSRDVIVGIELYSCVIGSAEWHTKAVAVKLLKRQTTMSSEALLQEAKIMKKMSHKRLVALYGIVAEDQPIYIVEEFMNKGSLLKCLSTEKILTKDLVNIASQVSAINQSAKTLKLI